MKTAIERSQFVIWFFLVLILLLSFLFVWKSIEREANQTAFTVARNRIVESANLYKQNWLLKGQPLTLNIDGQQLTMSKTGWVLPLFNNETTVSDNDQLEDDSSMFNCQHWLHLLYPDEKVLESYVVAIDAKIETHQYQCRYHYSKKQVITIEILNDKFTVSVGFPA
ncbi:MSHA biogenesis protein MshF [Vibrio aestuarianus subsp. cardii]|uniref:MSHA biogenesis protein MshF n=1 Tax=Vibrio aestuarianus TaxID=28171 RepID=UPI00159356D3|nr:MSHA biogenesis protein MshF [Vibrio aestuarianus]MDE1309427.1 MSHA biogenesis protein MshF [Vibrio aestuarianus]NGZ91561.1 MSHA biogenesis protein MshF [Vibrio aestuarianus subsp. cardii]